MADFPAMPFYTDAYLADTTHLSTLEHGAYLLLLFAAWRRPGCNLPDDDAFLARVVKQPVTVWRTRIRPIVEPFFEVADGLWVQKKQTKIRAHVTKVSTERRKAAGIKRGGEAQTKRGGVPDSQLSANPLSGQEADPAIAGANALLSKSKTKTESIEAEQASPTESLPPAQQGQPASPAASVVDRLKAKCAQAGTLPPDLDGMVAMWTESLGSADWLMLKIGEALHPSIANPVRWLASAVEGEVRRRERERITGPPAAPLTSRQIYDQRRREREAEQAEAS